MEFRMRCSHISVVFFFFSSRRRHTRFSRDWSSDVCSSDLIRIATLETSTLVSRRLATTRMVLCASPQYLQQRGTPVHPEELSDHEVIGYSYWSTRDEWRFDGPSGPVSVRTRPRIYSNNGETCLAAALAHQGVILQPSFLVEADLARGKLVELMPEYKSITLGIYAVYPTRKHVSHKVRALVDFLAERFAGKGA